MKKILSFIIIFKLALPVAAQNIPEVVTHKLNSSFASASDIVWSALSQERYQAHFMENGVDKSALFSKTESLLQLVFPIESIDFPVEVNNSFMNKFHDYEVLEAFRIEITQEVTFRVKIKKGKEGFEVVFDIFGKVKRQVKIEINTENTVFDKEEDVYCERHRKKHKINHGKKEKHNNKGRSGELGSIA